MELVSIGYQLQVVAALTPGSLCMKPDFLCDRVGMCLRSMCHGVGEGDCVTGWVCVHVVCVLVRGRGTV